MVKRSYKKYTRYYKGGVSSNTQNRYSDYSPSRLRKEIKRIEAMIHNSDLSTSDPSTSDPSTSDLSTSDLSTSDPSTSDPSTSDLSTSNTQNINKLYLKKLKKLKKLLKKKQSLSPKLLNKLITKGTLKRKKSNKKKTKRKKSKRKKMKGGMPECKVFYFDHNMPVCPKCNTPVASHTDIPSERVQNIVGNFKINYTDESDGQGGTISNIKNVEFRPPLKDMHGWLQHDKALLNILIPQISPANYTL